MIDPGLLLNKYVLGAALVGAALLFGYVQTKRLGETRAEHAAYVATVTAEAERASRENALRAMRELRAKERADEENARTVAALRARVERLRRESPAVSGGAAAPAPAASKCPDGQVCFDAAEYQRAYGVFAAGARAVADSCTEMIADLDTAKGWARGDQ